MQDNIRIEDNSQNSLSSLSLLHRKTEGYIQIDHRWKMSRCGGFLLAWQNNLVENPQIDCFDLQQGFWAKMNVSFRDQDHAKLTQEGAVVHEVFSEEGVKIVIEKDLFYLVMNLELPAVGEPEDSLVVCFESIFFINHQPTTNQSIAVSGQRMLVYGGWNTNLDRLMESFELSTGTDVRTLSNDPQQPKPNWRCGHASFLRGDHFCIFGGYPSPERKEPEAFQDAWVFSLRTERWIKVADINFQTRISPRIFSMREGVCISGFEETLAKSFTERNYYYNFETLKPMVLMVNSLEEKFCCLPYDDRILVCGSFGYYEGPKEIEGESDLFKKLHVDGSLSDCSLSVDGQILPVHKAFLAAKSEYFADLFAKSPSTNLVELNGLPIELIRGFLRFIYLGTLPTPITIVFELYDFGLVHCRCLSLVKECFRSMTDNLQTLDLIRVLTVIQREREREVCVFLPEFKTLENEVSVFMRLNENRAGMGHLIATAPMSIRMLLNDN